MNAPVTHRILASGVHGAVARYERGPGAQGPTTLALSGTWPTPAPRGDAFALSLLSVNDRGAPRSSIALLGAEGGEFGVAYESPAGGPAVIAPRVPHYVNWSPGGDLLSFVAPGSDGLGLFLSARDGSFTSDRIAMGAPVFSAWSPRGDGLAIHAGTHLSFYDASNHESRAIEEGAVGFRTPGVIDDEVYFLVVAPGGGTLLKGWDRRSGRVSDLVTLPGAAALLARPGSRQLAVTLADDPGTGVFQRLTLVDVDQPGRLPPPIYAGPHVSAVWSPDGRYLALVVPAQTGDGRYGLVVIDETGRYVCFSEAVVPSQDFRTVVSFFDQYAQSHASWAADSTAYVMAGRLPGDATSWSFSDGQDDYVLVQEIERARPLENLGPGDMAFFVPGVPA